MKRITGIAVFIALLCITSSAFADGLLSGTFHVYWNNTPPTGPGVTNTAQWNAGGYPGLLGEADGGGVFNNLLLAGDASKGTGGALQAQFSTCVEHGQFISPGSIFDVQVYSLIHMSATEKMAVGTYDQNNPAMLHTVADITNDHFLDLIWLEQKSLISTGQTGSVAQGDALQHAVWTLWGFTGYDTPDAQTLINGISACDRNDVMTNANDKYGDVLLAHNPVGSNGVPGGVYQDQVFVGGGSGPNALGDATPEGYSLVLLLPGLIPLGLALRRRARKA